ncbi:MAG: PEP-CTERM sorting domain-containing protein [Burkholderiales bacterium]
MKMLATLAFLVAALGLASSAQAATATFDDLPTLPAVNSATGLYFANGDSSSYAGVLWDTRFNVVGDLYRVDTITPGPRFGIPHSGRYFVTNDGAGNSNNGMVISTSMVLTGAWFGRNEYYGYGAGADQVTIYALSGSTELSSLVFDLPAAPSLPPGPEGPGGQPAVLQFFDTSAFTVLTGITGYRIDRREIGTLNGSWVADDFSFAAPVPEPGIPALLLAGLGVIGWVRRGASIAETTPTS